MSNNEYCYNITAVQRTVSDNEYNSVILANNSEHTATKSLLEASMRLKYPLELETRRNIEQIRGNQFKPERNHYFCTEKNRTTPSY